MTFFEVNFINIEISFVEKDILKFKLFSIEKSFKPFKGNAQHTPDNYQYISLTHIKTLDLFVLCKFIISGFADHKM